MVIALEQNLNDYNQKQQKGLSSPNNLNFFPSLFISKLLGSLDDL